MTTLLQAEKLTRWRLYFMTVLKVETSYLLFVQSDCQNLYCTRQVVFSPDSAHQLVSGSTVRCFMVIHWFIR